MAKRRRTRMSKTEYFQNAAQDFMREFNVSEFDPEDVAQWMVDNGKYVLRQPSATRLCKLELTKALKAQRMTDPHGRDVRAMLPVRLKNKQGELFSKWAPLYKATPQHARRSLQQWRRSIRGEVLLHDRTARSYNDYNEMGAQIPLFDYDMNKDRDEAAMPPDYPDERPSDDSPLDE